jgi:hypothetical protein
MMIIWTIIFIFIGIFIYFIGAIIFELSIEYATKSVWICDSHFAHYYEIKEPSSKVRKFFVILGEVLMNIGWFIAIGAIIFLLIQYTIWIYRDIAELIHNNNIHYAVKK